MPAELQSLKLSHLALMDLMLEHPSATYRELAHRTGFSQGYIAIIANSDIFQAKLAERRAEVEARIGVDIPTRLRALCSVALDRLGEHLETTDDPNFLWEVADGLLGRQGYGQKGAPAVAVQNNVNVTVDKDTLAMLREKIVNAAEPVALPPG